MEDFNYNEINKRATSPNLLKSYGVDIEKGGPGSGKHKVGDTVKFNPHGTKSGAGYERHEGEVTHDYGDGNYDIKDKKNFIAKYHQNKLDKSIVAGSTTGSETTNKQSSGEALKKESVEKGKTITVKTKDMVDEHEKLINTLESESKEDDKEEVQEQKKELKEYKEKLKKSFEVLSVDCIEKGNEGSRGGRVIGYTKSGKPIYDKHHSPSEAYGKFTKQDHLDAVKHHNDEKQFLHPMKDSEKMQKHRQAAAWHQGEVDSFHEGDRSHKEDSKEEEIDPRLARKIKETKEKIKNPELKEGLRKSFEILGIDYIEKSKGPWKKGKHPHDQMHDNLNEKVGVKKDTETKNTEKIKQLPVKVENFLDKFPDNATSWKDATDEIRDMARATRELYNELVLDVLHDDSKALQPLNFRELKTPAEWNKEGKEYIRETYSKLNKQGQEEFQKRFVEWFK